MQAGYEKNEKVNENAKFSHVMFVVAATKLP